MNDENANMRLVADFPRLYDGKRDSYWGESTGTNTNKPAGKA